MKERRKESRVTVGTVEGMMNRERETVSPRSPFKENI